MARRAWGALIIHNILYCGHIAGYQLRLSIPDPRCRDQRSTLELDRSGRQPVRCRGPHAAERRASGSGEWTDVRCR